MNGNKNRFHREKAITDPTGHKRFTTPTTELSSDAVKAITSTPATCTIAARREHQGTICSAARNREELVDELHQYFVGPMPPAQFLAEFLPRRSRRKNTITNPFHGLEYPEGTEDDMYEPFAERARQVLKSTELRITAKGGNVASEYLAPDISLYHKATGASESTSADFATAQLIIEMKPTASSDPFVDPPSNATLPHEFENQTDAGKDLRGQIASYLTLQVAYQYRRFAFAVVIFGTRARLLRWDPAGIIVTSAFDYTTDDFLADFLGRFDRLTDDKRGSDPTIVRIKERWPTELAPDSVLDDLVLYDERLGVSDPEGSYPKSAPHRHMYFCKMKIPDRDNPSDETDLIISFPSKLRPHSLIGHSPVKMYAYDTRNCKIVFVTQYWRPDTLGMEKEGDLYRHAVSKGVRNLAIFGKGNDIRDFTTVTQDVRNANPAWAQGIQFKEMVPRRLYRLSLETIGKSVLEYDSIKEFLSAMGGVMQCHDDLYFLAGLLYRNISPANMWIIPGSSAVLVDLSQCVRVNRDPAHPCPRAPMRPGVLQFMSARLLENPGLPQTIMDDRESALWVILWVVLHYAAHDHVDKLYKWHQLFDSRHGSAAAKKNFLRGGTDIEDVSFLNSPGINSLIEIFVHQFKFKYVGEKKPKRNMLQAFYDQGIKPQVCDNVLTPAQKRVLDRLGEKGTFVAIIERALCAKGVWSEFNDPAVRNIPLRVGTDGRPCTKRKAEAEHSSVAERAIRRSFNSSPPTLRPVYEGFEAGQSPSSAPAIPQGSLEPRSERRSQRLHDKALYPGPQRPTKRL